MESRDLTREQADKLVAKLAPMHGYLNRLKKRMERQHFPVDDELYRLTQQASDTMQQLTMHAHYLACGHGTGRPPQRK